jgi:hypothetical protein
MPACAPARAKHTEGRAMRFRRALGRAIPASFPYLIGSFWICERGTAGFIRRHAGSLLVVNLFFHQETQQVSRD